MAYSPTRVLPEPVGALTTTEWPMFKASIASSWKGSSGKGKSSPRGGTEPVVGRSGMA